MLRKSALIVVFTLFVPVAAVRGQSPGDPATGDLMKVCGAYSASQVVFVGRAEPPVTFHLSGEAEIEKARQNLIRTEAEVAHLRDTLESPERWEREREFALRIVHAQAEVSMRRAMYPRPMDLTLIPVSVEQAFRGVTESTMMLHRMDPSMTLEPGELYLISGMRSKILIPHFPEMPDLGGVIEYVDPARVTPVALARRDLQFLASTASGATVIGTLQMHSWGDGPSDPMAGVRIVVSSGTRAVETTTRADGSFIVSGIGPGRLEIRPILRGDLTVDNRAALTFQIEEGGCHAVQLTAALNGRLRGRILSATGNSLKGVEVVLYGMDSSGGLGSSNRPRISVRPNEDGTFEFYGVPPGSYLLSAGLEKMEDGKRRYLNTFFPGTSDVTAAVPVVIGKATQHDGFDFLVTTE